jgi:UDP-N-acetylmuramyl pentapeptide phosphotransferase/UDP-N-acetylglucosamine-1-phosphate transferase
MEHVFQIVLGFILATMLGLFIIPRILVISHRKRLFDMPDVRKVHCRPISRLGGVTFFPVIVLVMCSISLFELHNGYAIGLGRNLLNEMLCLLVGLMLLYIVGVCDDLIGVRYNRKFLVQILAAAFLPLSGLYIHNFYGLFGWYEIPALVGVLFTMLLTVFIINAINLIDGIDGLASGLCMVALSIFGVTLAINGWWIYTMLAFVCVGVLIPFFIYNVFGNAERGHKIFMGDTGSLTLGFIISLLAVKYIVSMGQTESVVDGWPLVIAFSVLLVPCLDVFRVILSRLKRRVHPFKPDRCHFHHKILNMGFTPRKALIFIELISIAFIAFTVLLVHVGVLAYWVFIYDVILWTLLNVWFSRIIRKKSYWVETKKTEWT